MLNGKDMSLKEPVDLFIKCRKKIKECEAKKPTKYKPGSIEKIALLSKRYELGIPMNNEEDVNEIIDVADYSLNRVPTIYLTNRILRHHIAYIPDGPNQEK